jgi:transposase-like protein
MSGSVKCPVCGRSFAGKPVKTWKFRFYSVGRYECDRCKTKFNVYESPKTKFTIPKAER